MIGIGVGIDYSLFIVTRFRQYLHEGLPPCDAAAEAGASAGRAVIFAGLTVAISVTGLAFFGLDFITKLGIGGGARRPHDRADRELAAHCRPGEARAQGRPPESAVPEADRRLRGRAPEHAHRTLGSVRNRPREAGVLDPARDRSRCSPGPRRSSDSARRIRARSRPTRPLVGRTTSSPKGSGRASTARSRSSSTSRAIREPRSGSTTVSAGSRTSHPSGSHSSTTRRPSRSSSSPRTRLPRTRRRRSSSIACGTMSCPKPPRAVTRRSTSPA